MKIALKKMSWKYKLFLGLLLLVCVESAVLAGNYLNLTKNKTDEQLAQIVMEKCTNAKFKPGCYDVEIPKLMDKPYQISMERAFQVTRHVQKTLPSYTYCHVLGHNLSSKETAKDPNKWKDVVTRCPSTMCNNGCLHGALMERYKAEYLNDTQIKQIVPELKTVCEPRGTWNPVGIERSMCYHALGHLNMYITNGDVKKSVNLCEKIGNNHHLQCTQGVLMSIFQPLGAEDLALIKGKGPTKKEEVKPYCDSFTGYARSACYKESWPLFREEIMTPEGAIKHCSYTTEPREVEGCYDHTLHIVTVVLVVDQNDLKKLTDYCMGLPENIKNFCFGAAADRLLQIDPILEADKAFRVCKVADGYGLGDRCYEMIINYGAMSFHKGTSGAVDFCKRFPSSWRQSCEKRLL